MVDVEDFYVLTEGGLCLYAKTQDVETQVKRDLFAGFVSAIQAFAKQMQGTGVDAFHLGASKVTFLKVKNLFFVVRTPLKENDKEVRKELQKMQEVVCQNSAIKNLAQWKGNLKEFACLDEVLGRFFPAPVERMRVAVW